MRKLILSFMVLALAVTFCHAGLTYNVKTEIELTPEMQKMLELVPPEMRDQINLSSMMPSFKVSVDGDRSRTEFLNAVGPMASGTFMISRDGGKIITCDPGARTCSEMDAGSAAQMPAGAGMSDLDIQYKPLLGKETLEGYSCHKGLLNIAFTTNGQDMKQVMTIWATKEIKQEGFQSGQMQNLPAVSVEMMKELKDIFENKIGFPLKMEIATYVNGALTGGTITVTMSDIQEKKLDASLFEVPEGYTLGASPIPGMGAGK